MDRLPAARPGPGGWRRLLAAGVVFVVAAVTFAVWTRSRLGGMQVTVAVDDLGQTVAAAIAAASCALAARRSSRRLRVAWILLAAAATSWCAGELVASFYEIGMRVAVPFPGLADIGFLIAVPLRLAAIQSFTFSARGTSTGNRLRVDRLTVTLSLLFVAWGLGLKHIYGDTRDPLFERVVDFAYPLGDVLIVSFLIFAIRRATDETHGRYLLLLGGVGAHAAADSAFAYLTANGTYGRIGSVLDVGWMAGYFMIALAAMWPSDREDRIQEEHPIDVWQSALPWMAVLLAGLTALVQAVLGHQLDTFQTALGGVIALLLTASQVLAQNDSRVLLLRSRLAARNLNDVIVNAPLGVVRIGRDGKILQANPAFATILHTTVEAVTGQPMTHFLLPSDMPKFRSEARRLDAGSVAKIDFDTQARRDDGSTLWLHWTAAAARGPEDGVSYYLAMFEDVSARHAAEAAAAANLEVLERLNRIKSQFITKVSHEFRTALVGIQGFSEFIEDSDQLSLDEVKAFAKDIYENARRLDGTIEEMQSLDASHSGADVLRIGEVDITRLLTDAVAEIQATCDGGHQIVVSIDSLPHVAANGELIHQLVTSLLARAISYSPDGAAVRLTAIVSKDEVCVRVTDEGDASGSDLDAQLLGAGNPGSTSAAAVLDRTLDLPMARQIVEMHGGRLWHETGAGTTWIFSLPVAAKPRPHTPAAAPDTP